MQPFEISRSQVVACKGRFSHGWLGVPEYLNDIQISYKPKHSRAEGATRIFNEEESPRTCPEIATAGQWVRPFRCEDPSPKGQAAEQNSSAQLDPESFGIVFVYFSL